MGCLIVPDHPPRGVDRLISHGKLDLEGEFHVWLHSPDKEVEAVDNEHVGLETDSLPGDIPAFPLDKAGDFSIVGILQLEQYRDGALNPQKASSFHVSVCLALGG